MKNLTRIIIGAILIACGVIYILGAFGIADVNISLDGYVEVQKKFLLH